MLYGGPNLEKFLHSIYFSKMSLFHRICCCFDMMRQLLRPLQRLHRSGYTHGDLKPENICIQLRGGRKEALPTDEPVFGEPYVSMYEFRLIDFGIVTRFKPKKLPRRYQSFLGNLCFASKRTLMQEQTRFHDDIESLLYVACQFLHDWLPWEDKRVREEFGLTELHGAAYKEAFKKMRIVKYSVFNKAIIDRFIKLVSKVKGFEQTVLKKGVSEDDMNPFHLAFKALGKINLQQNKFSEKYSL